MALTAPTLNVAVQNPTSLKFSWEEATGGTGPYNYNLYVSTTTGFTPGVGNIVASGLDVLEYTLSGLIPNTTYFAVLRAIDEGDSNADDDSAQKTAVTAGEGQPLNQFGMASIRGQLDLPYNVNTRSVQIDESEEGELYAGSPVKIVNSAGGVPKVVACAANSDDCIGFINYNIKNSVFVAGMVCEISLAGNVMWMYSTTAIARGARVVLDLLNNGVAARNGSGGEDVVGWAYDKATAAGQLIRVNILTPSFQKDA